MGVGCFSYSCPKLVSTCITDISRLSNSRFHHSSILLAALEWNQYLLYYPRTQVPQEEEGPGTHCIQAHASGDPRKNWGNQLLLYIRPFIVHITARHAKPTTDHHGNATGCYRDASTCAHNVYQALLSSS